MKKELEARRGSIIDVETLKVRIVQFRETLQTLKIDQSRSEAILVQKKAEIQAAENEIYQIKVSVLSKQYDFISNTDAKISETDSQISELERRLAYLRDERARLERSKLDARRVINEQEVRINFLNEAIRRGQIEIRKIEIEVDNIIEKIRSLTIRIEDLEIEIRRGVDSSIVREIEQKISTKTINIRDKQA